jgi:acyl-CoA reductase-like NAD-dependent aldehyde dehydrogenase
MDAAAQRAGQSEQAIELYVDGASYSSQSERVIEVVNPSNGRPCSWLSAGCQADVNCAVTAARRAFEDGRWTDAPPSFKKRALLRWAELIDREAGVLDALDAGEMGKPVSERLFSAAAATALVRFCAESIDKLAGDVYPSDKHTFVVQQRVPRGVVAAIVPWNFPTFNAVLKLAPALAAGNCVVLKPSELASRSAVRLAHLATEAGLPRGVLNVVPGRGEIVGRALGLHGDVDMVTFTGSTEIGKQMLQYAGQSNMKVVLTECGGKSPHIVFDDGIDLDAVADTIARSLLTNQGQICSLGSRLLVQRSIEATLLERIVARLQSAVVGDALDPRTTFGPLASAGQCERVLQFIAAATEEGARLVCGGRRVLRETGGFFVEPTVFDKVVPGMRIACEEVFGPVLAVIPFDAEADALRIANETKYGLAAYVWTTNLSVGLRVAKGVRCSVLVNAAAPTGEGAGHAASAEPARQSGVGTEGGLAGIESYMRRQLVWINHA